MAPDVTLFTHFSGWIGAGGASIIVVALLAYVTKRLDLKKTGSTDKPEPLSQVAVMQAALAEHFASERLNTEIAALRSTIDKLSHTINRFCDRLDMIELLKDHERERDRK